MNKRFKQYNATVEQVSDRKMSFTISTASVDRDNDTIDPKGWQLDNYAKNPVVLWAHDYSQPPVGKAVNIQSTADGLKAEVEFLPKGMSPFADMIHDMVKGGFLNATSVGFAGKDFARSKDREHGYDFKSQELLEFSIVPVPSNPEALVQRGLKNEQLQTYAKAMRDWANEVVGIQPPKLDEQQFADLASAMVKAMKEPKQEEKIEDKPVQVVQPVDVKALATEVAAILKADQEVTIDLKDEEVEIDINIPEEKNMSPEEVASFIEQTMKDIMQESLAQIREMAGAQARAAINHMTGRLD
jgi:HK97 family phage prohead protease